MGFFEKLKQGLAKTKNAIFGKIDSLFKRFRRVDEELFEELEELLIGADIGFALTEEILDELRDIAKSEKIKETEQIKEFPCCCDSTINEPKVRDISNCITARYNAGIQNQKQIGLCVVVKSKNGIEIPLYKETKHLRETIEQNNLYEGQPLNLDLYNRSAREHSQTLTDPKHNTQRLWDGLRIRKLTPKECLRLMGFDDEDFEKASKVNSNSQLYKQAGNSIVVNVLEHLLQNLDLTRQDTNKKMVKLDFEKLKNINLKG